MPRVAVYDMDGNVVEEMDLSQEVFGVEADTGLLHQVVRMYLANQRQGTADTKTRSEVSGGGRKPWRQKGTGRARQGSIRSPLWRHGGIVFGPHPRDYSFRIPKKAVRVALRGALSAKVRDGEFKVLRDLSLAEPKTKLMYGVLQKLKLGDKALIVTALPDRTVWLGARNIPGVTVVDAGSLNTLDVLKHSYVVATKEAVKKIEEALKP
ncbi:MAG TPA: 50S ribosomal protein L4 [Firmicutes bacterium]|nr:50S ribosomal protein L4 [Bacillota bacterium]